MTSQSLSMFVPTRATRRDPLREHPAPGPVLMADILVAPGGRPSLLALWAAWEKKSEP